MALAGGGGGGSEEAEKKKRRILDYLKDGDDGYEELMVSSSAAPSPAAVPPRTPRSLLPRFRWGRLVSFGNKSGGKEVEVEVRSEEVPVDSSGGKEVEVEERRKEVPVDSSGWKPESSSSPSNLGIGLSLVFLVAKSSIEFKKMIEVRTQMETLLREIKDEVRRKGATNHDFSRNCNLQTTASSYSTDIKESENAHLEGHVTSSSMEGMSCEKSSEDESCLRMDMLQEEFQVELERLQLNLDTECSSLLAQQQNTESLDEFIDFGGRFSHNLEEIVEAENEDDTQHYGVSALELERRLHEILHQRNQERIEELESALQCAEGKLLEKEMELCLWKDTVKLALRHDNLK